MAEVVGNDLRMEKLWTLQMRILWHVWVTKHDLGLKKTLNE